MKSEQDFATRYDYHIYLEAYYVGCALTGLVGSKHYDGIGASDICELAMGVGKMMRIEYALNDAKRRETKLAVAK